MKPILLLIILLVVAVARTEADEPLYYYINKDLVTTAHQTLNCQQGLSVIRARLKSDQLGKNERRRLEQCVAKLENGETFPLSEGVRNQLVAAFKRPNSCRYHEVQLLLYRKTANSWVAQLRASQLKASHGYLDEHLRDELVTSLGNIVDDMKCGEVLK